MIGVDYDVVLCVGYCVLCDYVFVCFDVVVYEILLCWGVECVVGGD